MPLPFLSAASSAAGPRRSGRLVLLRVVAALSGAVLLGLSAWRRELDTALAAAAVLAVVILALRRPRSEGGVPLEAAAPSAPAGEGLIAAFPDPTIVVDERSVVIDLNPAALSVAPLLKVGHPLSFALRAPQVLDAIPPVISTRKAAAVEWGGRVPTEAAYEVRVSAVERPASRGGTAALLAFRDLTAQRRSERIRVDFVANVSHELRTPLTAILGFIETLQGPARNDPAARERFLGIMHGQANRMKRLIDDLLHLSGVEMRIHRAPTATVDLGAAVAEMIEIMAPVARKADVTVPYERPAAPVHVRGDRDELLRLVENLLANAIRYGGAGRVDVRVRPVEDGRSVELAIRDHGPGIAPEHLPRLTERFYRADVADSRAQGGTGLGLAIVKHIVSHHRGRLFIESEPGQGAEFRIWLPAVSSAPDGAA